MLIYFGLGALWAWWLEWYTTTYLEGVMDTDWQWKERFFHIGFWPLTFSFFIYTLLRNK